MKMIFKNIDYFSDNMPTIRMKVRLSIWRKLFPINILHNGYMMTIKTVSYLFLSIFKSTIFFNSGIFVSSWTFTCKKGLIVI